MMEILINILIIIGAVVSVLGACFFGMFGFMVLWELIAPEYNNFKFQLQKDNYKIEKELLAIKKLEVLKEKYPNLEIKYTKK